MSVTVRFKCVLTVYHNFSNQNSNLVTQFETKSKELIIILVTLFINFSVCSCLVYRLVPIERKCFVVVLIHFTT